MIIRLSHPLSLIFFVLFFADGCRQKPKEEINIVWAGKQATAISIPKSFLDNGSDEVINKHLQIRLEKSSVAMLGETSAGDDQIIFKPLIPLSPGKRYEVLFKEHIISRLSVPLPDPADAPGLICIYPSADTLPENLLKIYLQFSAPMREGEALQHIHLLNEKADTIPNIFLDLQPELWNKERTALTVWLDPGRIKRDLIPNERLGNPLQKGKQYTFVIDDKWKNAQGLPLKKPYTKKFIVAERDGISPQPERWLIDLPAVETTQPLRIYFKEPLDYFLLMETIQIMTEKREIVEGDMRLMMKETGLTFLPKKPWPAGKYRLKTASYLEDLAGNNLNRLFDRDTKLQQKKEGDFFEREFIIQ